MKVARPEWLLESIKAGVLLPWQNFVFRPTDRLEEPQGRRVAQKSIMDTFTPQLRRDQKKDDIPKSTPRSRSRPPECTEDQVPQTVEVNNKASNAPANPSTLFLTPSKRPESPDSLHTTDQITPKQTARVPEYAAHESNPIAQRAMADPAWRAAHTSVAPDFIEGYYRHSRLHHLSMWKAELKDLVAEAQEKAEKGDAEESARDAVEKAVTAVEKIFRENVGGKHEVDGDVSMRGAQLVVRPDRKGKGKEKAMELDEERIIMHCDFDSFFVSAGLVDRPHLRGKPVVVCHSQGTQGGGTSTSEIASASYEARKFGIKGGMRYVVPCLFSLCSDNQRSIVYSKLESSVQRS